MCFVKEVFSQIFLANFWAPKNMFFLTLDPQLLKMKTALDSSETLLLNRNFMFVSHFFELTIVAIFEVRNFRVSTLRTTVMRGCTYFKKSWHQHHEQTSLSPLVCVRFLYFNI